MFFRSATVDGESSGQITYAELARQLERWEITEPPPPATPLCDASVPLRCPATMVGGPLPRPAGQPPAAPQVSYGGHFAERNP